MGGWNTSGRGRTVRFVSGQVKPSAATHFVPTDAETVRHG
jgi:hypothetical protein